MCPKHRTRYLRGQDENMDSIYEDQEYIIHDEYAEIVLKDKYRNIVGYAIIDVDDVEKCKKYKWHMRNTHNINYAIASLPENKKIHLHRYVLNYNGDKDVDHINHNGLDNRKDNLRVVNHPENMRNQKDNRIGIKKVPSGRYSTVVTVNYKAIYLGTFDTYDEALDARIKFLETLK